LSDSPFWNTLLDPLSACLIDSSKLELDSMIASRYPLYEGSADDVGQSPGKIGPRTSGEDMYAECCEVK